MAYPDIYQPIANYLGISLEFLLVLLTIIGIWSLVWKGIALWKSARKNQSIWFIILLVINTMGILEILYIFVFSKIGLDEKRHRQKKKK
jgi:uncharacterized membrane protein